MNLLVTGAWPDGKKQIQTLADLGHSVYFLQQEKDALPCPYDWVEGVICNGLFLYHQAEKFINLRFVQLTSAGYDRVPLDYMKQNGIQLYNAGGVYSIPMAEFALCSVLQFYKCTHFFYQNQTKKLWEKNRTLQELGKKNVCIIGCGNVGTECAIRFKAFGCKVFGLDVQGLVKEPFDQIEPISKLDDILAVSDVVVLTLPLTDQTYHLLNADRINLLKTGCVLINIARGGLIDTAAMIDRLQKNDIKAALDVFEEEPIAPDHPLWKMQNVFLTPHNSFVGENNAERLNDRIYMNLIGSNKNA